MIFLPIVGRRMQSLPPQMPFEGPPVNRAASEFFKLSRQMWSLPWKISGVERIVDRFPFNISGPGKVRLSSQYPFYIRQATLNVIQLKCKTVESYIPGLLRVRFQPVPPH